MLDLSFSSGLAAQDDLARLVAAAKDIDPLGQVTLVVESNHQALQFRRQLVRSLLRSGMATSQKRSGYLTYSFARCLRTS